MANKKAQVSKEEAKAQITALIRYEGASMKTMTVVRNMYLNGVLTLDEIKCAVESAKASKGVRK